MKSLPIASLALMTSMSLTSCAQQSKPAIDLEYETLLIEYEACLDTSKKKWENTLGTESDLPFSLALKDCESIRP